jgi:hypothetical protein
MPLGPADIVATTLVAPAFTTSVPGLVPASGGSATTYLNGAGAFTTPPVGSTVTPAALTKTDDTNVTLTLGGTPATALLQASSITVGWSGTLALGRGGTGAATAAAAATALGVGTGDSPQHTAVNIGNATDTTLARQGAGVLAMNAWAQHWKRFRREMRIGRIQAANR